MLAFTGCVEQLLSNSPEAWRLLSTKAGEENAPFPRSCVG